MTNQHNYKQPSVTQVCVCVCVFQVIPQRSINFDVNKQKRELIAQLECKNRLEIICLFVGVFVTVYVQSWVIINQN